MGTLFTKPCFREGLFGTMHTACRKFLRWKISRSEFAIQSPRPPDRARPGKMEEPEMQLKVKKVTDKFTESMYILANEPSVALYRLQEHVRRSLPELAQHKCHQEHEGQQCVFQKHRRDAQTCLCHERSAEFHPQVVQCLEAPQIMAPD
uniref:BLOC-1 related complex subunit 8 n=1 Tax=Varanus komodoensis TaxID=61221 RepID=A0A8D2L5J9_VARKO